MLFIVHYSSSILMRTSFPKIKTLCIFSITQLFTVLVFRETREALGHAMRYGGEVQHRLSLINQTTEHDVSSANKLVNEQTTK